MLQRTIAQPHTIIDRTPAIVFASQITVSDVQITISVTETVICGGHQNPANQRVPDGSEEIIISVPKTIIDGNETIISVLQIMISKTNAIMSKRILVIDGPYTIISGLDSIIYRHEAIVSVVETMISTMETDFSKTDAIISAFATRFLAAEITVSAAEITTRAVPVGCAPSTNPTFPGFRLMALILFKDRKTLDLRCGKCQTRVMARLDIDINKLSPEERLDLIEELWDSLSADPAKIPLTDAQAKELDHRVSEMDLWRTPSASPGKRFSRRFVNVGEPTCRYSATAAAEIEAAYRWYEQEREGLGLEFLEAVEQMVKAIAEIVFIVPPHRRLVQSRALRGVINAGVTCH